MATREYDSVLSQYCGWYEDTSSGGLEGALKRMLQADPEWLLGRALEMEFELMNGLNGPRLDAQLAARIEQLNELAQQKKKNKNNDNSSLEHELMHVQVVNDWAQNELVRASRTLEQITTLYPEDVSALKMNQDTLFMLGGSMQMRNSLAGALRNMSKKNPLRGYAHGMFAFAYEESNMYPAARREAQMALSLNPNDTWAIHNYAHCLEMEAHHEEGLKWMLDKKIDWEPCQTLACHQYWHTALFHLNQGHLDEVKSLLDDEILTRLSIEKSVLNLHDAASMIYRLNLIDFFKKHIKLEVDADCSVRERWAGVADMCGGHQRDHLVGFTDAHFMMAYLGIGDRTSANELLETIDEITSLNMGQEVVKPLMKAMIEFDTKNYENCVQLLEPIRFEIVKIGGSHAQRDVFDQLLLVAALRSNRESDQKLAQRMIRERETFHGGRQTTLTQLLSESK